MSLFRARIALRPVLRAPAPTLTRGIRNYDVNTPSEPIADKMQGTEAPDLNNEQAAKAGKYESAEDKAFARAEENVMKDGGGKDAGKINERDVNLGVNRNADKVSSLPGLTVTFRLLAHKPFEFLQGCKVVRCWGPRRH